MIPPSAAAGSGELDVAGDTVRAAPAMPATAEQPQAAAVAPGPPGAPPADPAASGLDLAIAREDVREERQTLSAPEQVADSRGEAMELAAYGVPDTGPVGVLKYWYQVYTRQKVLRGELEQAEQGTSEAGGLLHDAASELGRDAHGKGIKGDDVDKLISAALVEQGNQASMERGLEALRVQHVQERQQLEQTKNLADEEAQPLRDAESRDRAALDKLKTYQTQLQQTLQQTEAQQQQLTELIGKKQEDYVSPEASEERKGQLFKEVSQLEDKRNLVEQKITQINDKFAELDPPLRQAEQAHAQTSGALAAKNQQIGELRRAATQRIQECANLEAAEGEKVKQQGAKVDDCWTSVGLKVNEKYPQFPGLEERQSRVSAMRDGSAKASHRVEVISLALEVYDVDAVARAKKVAIGVGAGLLVLFILLGVFA